MTEEVTVERESAADGTEGTPIEVYEWGGAIVAGLGFFMTPLLTGLPAIYCALKIQEEKPLAAIGIGLVILATVVFWGGFLFGEQVIELISSEIVVTSLAVFAFFGAILVIPLVAFLTLVILRR